MEEGLSMRLKLRYTKKTTMNSKLYIVLIVIFGAVFLVSGSMLVYRLIQYRQGDDTYREAGEIAATPASESASSLSSSSSAVSEAASAPGGTVSEAETEPTAPTEINLPAVQAYNGDVVGWIEVPGTVVFYPLMQSTDNEFYLTHTWKKAQLSVGSIFLDCANSSDLSDFNSIIYGHNMYNGSMFATIYNYRNQSYWEAHPDIYITTASGLHRYAVYAAFQVSTDALVYQRSFLDDASKANFLDFSLRRRFYNTGETPSVSDRVITLSTCIGSDNSVRFVVQAVLKNA